MSDYTLTVPEAIVVRAQEIAERTAQSVDQVMLERLQTLSVPALSADEEAELDALKHLSADALWTIAREQMLDSLQARMQFLMDKNSEGSISPDEYAELELLVERGQRLMLRKSEAAALLKQRGYNPFGS